MKKKIGFIGISLMGLPMALNLLKFNFKIDQKYVRKTSQKGLWEL